MMNMGYLNARWVLGWALVKHVILRSLSPRDPQDWVRRIAVEDLAATPAAGWSLFANSSRCIACGMCDVVAGPGERPSSWIAGSVRRPQDAPLALAQAAVLRRLAPQIDAICPAQVRAAQVAELIEAQAATLQRVQSSL